MCGIVAYCGSSAGIEVLIRGLKRLEYRGYDSAGLCVMPDEGASAAAATRPFFLFKKKGRVAELEAQVPKELNFYTGIAHTRWATHGEPNDVNAHPHASQNGDFVLVHNGIIENHNTLKKELLDKGYVFKSETDTEVLANFIEHVYRAAAPQQVEEAVCLALSRVVGAYALAILSPHMPQGLMLASKGSPLVVGVRGTDHFVASDASPLVEYTQDVVYVKDGQVGSISRGKLRLTDLSNVPQKPFVERLDLKLDAIEKGGYAHFMLKEIFAQPEAVADTMRGRIRSSDPPLVLGGIRNHLQKMSSAKRILMLGCGSSWHAALVGEYLFEELCQVPVEVEYASEFRYRNPIVQPDDLVLAISQSGETADTRAALLLAKEKAATCIGVVNVVGSSVARLTHAGIYLHAGPEIGVASTKSFTTQIVALAMMALNMAQQKKILPKSTLKHIVGELAQLPQKIREVLKVNNKVLDVAKQIKHARNCLYLGRGCGFPVALEGALKLKEISYIHAEGYPAAEMKHGPIALIDENMPVIFVTHRQDPSYEKILSNIQEVKARKGKVIAIVSEEEEQIRQLADELILIPNTHELLSPVLSVIPLQLLAYHTATLLGRDADRPRNLAKSVTVE